MFFDFSAIGVLNLIFSLQMNQKTFRSQAVCSRCHRSPAQNRLQFRLLPRQHLQRVHRQGTRRPSSPSTSSPSKWRLVCLTRHQSAPISHPKPGTGAMPPFTTHITCTPITITSEWALRRLTATTPCRRRITCSYPFNPWPSDRRTTCPWTSTPSAPTPRPRRRPRKA